MGTGKPRIALVTSVIDARKGRGTASVARELLARILASDEFDFTLIHHEPVDDPLYAKHPTLLIPHLPFPFDRAMLREAAFWLSRRERFDAVHYLTPRVWPSYLLTRAKRVIISAHDAGVMLDLGPADLPTLVFRFTNRFLHARMDAVIAVSEYARAEIARAYRLAPERVAVIPNALPTSFGGFSADPLALGEPYLLSVGRFDPHKNILRLLAAYAEARKAGVTERLVLLGGRHLPAYSRKVEATIRELDLESEVTIAPFIPDDALAGAYAHARAVIYPSLHEGFGLPLLEAMASGVPVAAAGATALPEVAGGAALLFDPRDARAMASAIARVLGDEALRADLIARGRTRVRAFSWEESASRLVALYRALTA